MKKITILFMLLLSLQGFSQLALQDFEGTWTPLTTAEGPAGPAGWYIKNVQGAAQTWALGTGGTTQPAYSGSHSAYLNKENTVTGQPVAEDWLITPQFNVPTNGQLQFYSRLTSNGDQGTAYKVMIGTDPADASTFVLLQDWTELTLNPVQLVYTQKTVNIPATYSGQQRYIAFIMMGDDGDRWLVDDVQVIEQCFAPTALTANPTGTAASLSWTSTATSFEVEVVPASVAFTNTGVPYAGALPYVTPATLTPSTQYKYQVRAMCSPGNYSPWAGPFNFTTSQIAAPLPFTEGFEGTINWAFANGTQTNQWFSGIATNNGGTHALYVSNDLGISNVYTVSPSSATSTVQAYRDIQMPAAVDQLTLSFDWKAFGESCCDFLTVWLVPSSYTPTAGTATTAANSGGVQIGGNFNVNGNWTTFTTVLNGTAYAGTVRRLIFEWHNDLSVGTQPPSAIDNVNLSVITCPAPTNLALASLTNTTANFTWTGPTSVTPTFDYYYNTTNTAPVAGTTPTGNATTAAFGLTPLTPSTTYYFWVRSNCGSGDASTWTGPVSFTTPQVPATLNYSQDFEGTPGWAFVNGTQTNQWALGTATSSSPTHSIYISNDNGVTYTYNNGATTTVQAYRDISIPTGTAEVNLSFDWKANGESCCDFLRVWLVPVTFTPTAGTAITTASGGIQIGANFNVNSNWVNYLNTINVAAYAGTLRRLVFEWHNDGSIGTIPAAVDNVNITIVTCPKPTALTAVVSSTSATLGWTPAGTETSWEVYVVPTGSAAPTATTAGTTVTTNPYIYSPLSPITTYQFYVRALCSTSDKSIWSGPFSFTTSVTNDDCSGAITLPVNTGTSCTQVTPAAFTGANASTLAACTGANGPDIWFQFTALQATQTISLSGFTIVNTTAQNVVLGLYDGSCGSLTTPIFCSNDNVINASGLTPGTIYILRATLSPVGTTAANLNTAFNICITTPPPPSATNQSDCVISTVNPSFEVPATITNGLNNVTISQNVVPGWRTTATDGMIEFWPVPNNVGVTAAAGTSGSWFIELNANQSAAVYQDFSTPQPTTFTIQFAHRGRQGVDTMRLLAGNANDPISTYTQVGSNFSDGTAAWAYYGVGGTLTYTVPSTTQTTTRFVFEAVSTSTGDPTIGNFLDEIRFTANNGILSANPVSIDCATPTTNISAAGAGTWTAHADNPGPSVIANPAANNTTISGFTTQGVYHYDWTTNYCTSTLELTYNGLAIAVPVTNTTINYCEGATATQLTATALTGYTLHWYDVAAGGTELAAAPTPDTTTPSVTVYYVSQSLAICEGPRAAITVTVNEVPAAPTATGATYCQNATATVLTATGDAANTINWYTVATGGTPLAAAPTPNTAILGTTTYYVSQQTAAGCESPRTQVDVLITTPQTPVTSFTYTTPVCIAGTNPVPATPAGFATGGTFTAPAGVTINAATGEIDLATSTAGTYIITYSVAANATICTNAGLNNFSVTIAPLTVPVTGFTYPTVCTTAANQLPALTTGFATGGTFTSSDAALVVDPATGEINVATSTPGTYTVTYNLAIDPVNCYSAASTPATVTITPLATPVVAFSYVNSCTLEPNQLPAIATGFAAGGTFTASNASLVVNPVTGEINTSASAAGTYIVTYAVPQDNVNCTAANSGSTSITITAPAAAVTGFTYANVCSTTASELPALDPGFTAGGTFTVSAGLTIDPVTGALTIPSNAGGTYTITYTIPQSAANCIAGVANSVPVVITTAFIAETGFDYDTTYCFGAATATPSYNANFAAGGTFTVTGGLSIDPSTGAVDLTSVAAGSYTVTYTVAPDPATCNLGGSTTDSFAVGSQSVFTLEGNCDSSAYVITSKPTNSSFDPEAVTYEWTVGGAPAGTDSASFNVTEYVNGTQATETFPFDVVLTVVNNGCPTPVSFTVNDISCEIQKGISPGDSSDNNFFDLAYMGVAKLTIFNRYGLEVYSKHNYTTEWTGQTNSGDELPTGTYFYVIDKNVGDTKTGWIYINRQN